jgi:hypothetical protein
MRKLILFAMLAAPLMAQNYGSYSSAPVARLQFMRNQGAVKGNIFGDASLIGWWPMTSATGSIAHDMSGTGNNGTWTGTRAGSKGYWSAGKIGPWAGYFDGSTNYVSVANPPNISGLTQLTVAAWIYQTGNTENYGGIAGYGGYTSNTGFDLVTDTVRSSPSGLYFQVGNTGLSRSGCIVWGAWHLVVGVQSTTGQRLYVDGTLVVSNTTTATVNDPSAYLFQIGYRSNGDSLRGHFAGKVQDVRIYSRALSQAEIQAIYAAENH